MKHKRALLLATLALVASCSDSGPGGGTGSFSFDYTGVVSGHFDASGAIPLFPTTDRAWAVGIRDDTQGSFGIAAVVPSDNPKYHLAAFSVPRLTPGSETVDLINCSSSSCPALLVIFGANDATGESDYMCGLETGTLVLSTITESRATGTFSGTGTCLDNVQTVTTFTVTGGTFSVPVRSSTGP